MYTKDFIQHFGFVSLTRQCTAATRLPRREKWSLLWQQVSHFSSSRASSHWAITPLQVLSTPAQYWRSMRRYPTPQRQSRHGHAASCGFWKSSLHFPVEWSHSWALRQERMKRYAQCRHSCEVRERMKWICGAYINPASKNSTLAWTYPSSLLLKMTAHPWCVASPLRTNPMQFFSAR